jgi:hypothetical protein
MRKLASTLIATLTLAVAGIPVASAQEDRSWNDLDDVRVATGVYHSLDAAIADGFVPFGLDDPEVATCFENEAGGMGIHYVRNIDDSVSATDPEAMVYEITPDGANRLVAVEYIVPEEFVEDGDGSVASLPNVLGQDFHKHSFLPVYILHAWVWEENPSGVYADYNPNVSGCPAA